MAAQIQKDMTIPNLSTSLDAADIGRARKLARQYLVHFMCGAPISEPFKAYVHPW